MEVQSKWESLPLEILNEIFQLIDDRHHVTHVCKTWKFPAQIALYSNVMFKTFPQLQKFHNTVQHNSHLGDIVKKLDHDFKEFLRGLKEDSRQSTATEITNLLKRLLNSYLPNLEEICDSVGENPGFGVRSYIPILDALQNSQLERLKIMYSSLYQLETEYDVYCACVLLMKDRLENLALEGDLENNRLFNSLHQFGKLKELDMAYVEQIEHLDHIITSCKSLRALDIADFEINMKSTSSSVNHGTISNTCNIKSLKLQLVHYGNYRLLSYIMHKFPNLEYVDMNLSLRLDREMFSLLLNLSSKIEDFNAHGIRMDHDQIIEAMSEFNGTAPIRGTDAIEFNFSDNFWRQENCMFTFHQEKSKIGTGILFTYPLLELDWKYIEYLKKNGKYIGNLWMKFTTKDAPRSAKCELPKSFMTHVLTHCPNLYSLMSTNCVLKRLTYTSIDLREARLIKDLYFGNCIIYPGVLEQLSPLFPKIERLFFSGEIIYRNSENESPELGSIYDNSKIEIVMWTTEINTVVFEENYYDKIVYIKVFALKDRDYYYHRFDKDIEASNEEEYTVGNNNLHVYICCQNKPKFVFKSS